MISCKNCATDFEGKYCPHCGQKAKTTRITLRQVLSETRQHFIHFDQGFLYTIKQLAIRPGHTIREYIDGKRVKHIKPIRFWFWATTISILLFHLWGLDEIMLQKITENNASVGHSQEAQLLGQKLTQKIFEHPTVTQVMMVPWLAFFSWLLFRRRGHNYAEHFVFNTYIMAEVGIASIFTMPLMFSLRNVMPSTSLGLISLVLWGGYMGWAYNQFYHLKHRTTGFLRALLVMILGYVMMILMISVIIVVAIVFFKPYLTAWINS